MLTANVLGVEQKMDFSTKTIRNYMVFELGGLRLHAELENIDEVSDLIARAMGEEFKDLKTEETAESFPAIPEEALFTEPAPIASDELFDWRSLPDSSLPQEYKVAFDVMGVPSPLPASKIQELAKDIEASFTSEDWNEAFEVARTKRGQEPPLGTVVAAPQPSPVAQPGTPIEVRQPANVPNAPPPQPAQNPLSEVQWMQGNVALTPVTPTRTVPKDEMGYPIVSNADIDPGEVIGGSDVTDEDGVGQL